MFLGKFLLLYQRPTTEQTIWPFSRTLTSCLGTLTRSSVETGIRVASVGLVQLAGSASSQRWTQAVESVSLLDTLTPFEARIWQAWVLLTITALASELVWTVTRNVLK